MTEIGTLVSTVGYPIATAIVIGWVAYKMYIKMVQTLDAVTSTNAVLVETNKSLISNLDNKIDKVEIKVDRIIDVMRN